MRVVIVNRFFWPDHSATSQLAADLAFHVGDAGHEVTAVASRQRYDDPSAELPADAVHRGVAIRRVWTTQLGRHWLPGRAVDYLTFYIACFVALFRLAYPGTVILAKTDPPLLSVVAAMVAKLRGAQLVTWQQDIFPEVARALGLRWVAGPVAWLLRTLRNGSLRTARLNVVLDAGMAERLSAEGIPADRVRIIPNWSHAAVRPVPPSDNPLRDAWGLGDRLVIGYSGNLGRAHMADAVADLVRRTWDLPGIAWLFVGGGAGADRVREVIRETGAPNVRFQPYQPRDALSLSLSAADVHLVSLDPACEGLIVPSKFSGILAAGRAVLYLGDPAGAMAREIDTHALGLVLDAGQPSAWRAALQALLASPSTLADKGARARDHYERRYHTDRLLAAWVEALQGE